MSNVFFIKVRYAGAAPASPDWKSGIIADIRMPHFRETSQVFLHPLLEF